MKQLAILILFFNFFILNSVARAAPPTLQDAASIVPAPVVNFFQSLQNFDFRNQSGVQDIKQNLPVAGKPVVSFLNFVWGTLYGFFKVVGSVFVWIFHGIANFFDKLIFTR